MTKVLVTSTMDLRGDKTGEYKVLLCIEGAQIKIGVFASRERAIQFAALIAKEYACKVEAPAE